MRQHAITAPVSLARATRSQPQTSLFEIEPAWSDLWWGMPSFVLGDARPLYRITVNFFSVDAVQEFAQRLGVAATASTDSVTFPPERLDKPSDWEYIDE